MLSPCSLCKGAVGSAQFVLAPDLLHNISRMYGTYKATKRWRDASRPRLRLAFGRSFRLCLGALGLALWGLGSLWAGSNDRFSTARGDSILELFEARYRAAKTLSAAFLEQFLDDGKLVRREAGRAYFLHPGRMRWNYEAPEKNTFLVDGKYVWFYSPADRTATRSQRNKARTGGLRWHS